MTIGILSGHYPGLRFNSQVNHKLYADRHDYRYVFNGAPERDRRLYFRKLETIARYLDLFDWVFWIDDDAYFTDHEIPLERFTGQSDGADLVICRSPSTKRIFTKFSSGQFLLRNSPRAHALLAAALATDLTTVEAFWREDLGMFTRGDQDVLVYLSEVDRRFNGNFFRLLPHDAFNNRDFEYVASPTEHFLVHFTGKDKPTAKRQFCTRLGCNAYLVPDDLVEVYGLPATGDQE